MGADNQKADLPRIELLLREAVGAVRAMRWRIAPNRFISERDRCCCPIGALWLVCAGRPGEGNWELADRILGVDFDAGAFTRGFDDTGLKLPERTPEWELGARLRREWVAA